MANREITLEDRRRWGSEGGRAWAANHTPLERSRAAALAGVASRASISPQERIRCAREAALKRWKRFVCEGCGKITPSDHRIADDMPNHCTDCWNMAHEAPVASLNRPAPKNRKERLAAGLCRACSTPRFWDEATGKVNAQWCNTHLIKQQAYDKKSWHGRKAV